MVGIASGRAYDLAADNLAKHSELETSPNVIIEASYEASFESQPIRIIAE